MFDAYAVCSGGTPSDEWDYALVEKRTTDAGTLGGNAYTGSTGSVDGGSVMAFGKMRHGLTAIRLRSDLGLCVGCLVAWSLSFL